MSSDVVGNKYRFLKTTAVINQENVIERWHQRLNCLRDIIPIIVKSLGTITLDSLWLFWEVIFVGSTESV